MRQVSAVHYEDVYPKSFVAFRKKYLPLLKSSERRHLYIQFTNFMDDTLSKKPYETPDHHDPVAIYGYPLEYVLKHPADIWYGGQAKYLRVLKQRKNNKTLLLQYLTEWEANSILSKMGLPNDSMEKAKALWPDRVGKGAGSIGRAFFQAMQMDMSAVGKIPRGKDERKALAGTIKVRSGKEQTALLRKAGFDAIEDNARNQKTAVINPREPEQIAFLHRNAFDVVEVVPLSLKQTKTSVGTSQNPSELAPKLAAMIANRIDDRLVDRDEHNRTFWTAGGREITVNFERPSSYYEGKKLGEKKHRESKLTSLYLIKVVLTSERGVSRPTTSTSKFSEIADEVADLFRLSSPVDGFQPISRASRAAEREAASKAYYKKEKDAKLKKLEKEVPEYLKDISEVAAKFGVPFTQAEYLNSSDDTREMLDGIIRVVGRNLTNDAYRVRNKLNEQDPQAWDWYSIYDRNAAMRGVADSISTLSEDISAPPVVAEELTAIFKASLDWMLDNKKWSYQHPSGFFMGILRDMKESEPAAVEAAAKLLAEAADLLSGSKVSGYLVEDVVRLKHYLTMDDAGKGYEIAWSAWPLFVGWAEETQPEGIDVDGLDVNDQDSAETNIGNIPEEVFAQFWKETRGTGIDEYVPPAVQPTFLYMDYRKIVKDEWLVHFSKAAGSIAVNGFRYGIDDITTLGLTTHFVNKTGPGFNFAYLADDATKYGRSHRHGGWKYGDHAVMFKANGVLVYHFSDEEPQVIFLGSTAKDIVELENTDDGWAVIGNSGPVFQSGDWNTKARKSGSSRGGLQRCIDWVETNYNQYKSVLNQKQEKPRQRIAAGVKK